MCPKTSIIINHSLCVVGHALHVQQSLRVRIVHYLERSMSVLANALYSFFPLHLKALSRSLKRMPYILYKVHIEILLWCHSFLCHGSLNVLGLLGIHCNYTHAPAVL